MKEFFGIVILFFFFFGFINYCISPDEKDKKNMGDFEKAVGNGLKKYFVLHIVFSLTIWNDSIT